MKYRIIMPDTYNKTWLVVDSGEGWRRYGTIYACCTTKESAQAVVRLLEL